MLNIKLKMIYILTTMTAISFIAHASPLTECAATQKTSLSQMFQSIVDEMKQTPSFSQKAAQACTMESPSINDMNFQDIWKKLDRKLGKANTKAHQFTSIQSWDAWTAGALSVLIVSLLGLVTLGTSLGIAPSVGSYIWMLRKQQSIKNNTLSAYKKLTNSMTASEKGLINLDTFNQSSSVTAQQAESIISLLKSITTIMKTAPTTRTICQNANSNNGIVLAHTIAQTKENLQSFISKCGQFLGQDTFLSYLAWAIFTLTIIGLGTVTGIIPTIVALAIGLTLGLILIPLALYYFDLDHGMKKMLGNWMENKTALHKRVLKHLFNSKSWDEIEKMTPLPLHDSMKILYDRYTSKGSFGISDQDISTFVEAIINWGYQQTA